MCVVGIDQSVRGSGVAIIALDGSLIHLSRISPPTSLRDVQRLQFIRDELIRILDEHPNIQLGCLEGYSYNSTNKKFLLGEVGSIVKLALADKQIKLYEVAPLAVKKFVTGRGGSSADKIVMRVGIYAKWGIDIDQDDKADAYALAQIARSLILKNSNNRAELEVLKKLCSIPLKKSKRRSRLSALSNSL